jgi:hypothetical protein
LQPGRRAFLLGAVDLFQRRSLFHSPHPKWVVEHSAVFASAPALARANSVVEQWQSFLGVFCVGRSAARNAARSVL